MKDHQELFQVIDRFSNQNILVIGDLILDAYLHGVVDRISPEAPVPVVQFEKQEYRLGGACNVAQTLCNLGAQVWLVGTIGTDTDGDRLLQLLVAQQGIHTHGIARLKSKTSIKTRIVAGQQQLLRIDHEDTQSVLDPKKLESMLTKILSSSGDKKSFDAILISDYGKGVINKESFQTIRSYIEDHAPDVPYTAIDPKKENFPLYQSFKVMTPNHKEAFEDSGLLFDTDENVLKHGPYLLEKHNLCELLVTRGAKGMALFEKEKDPVLIPTYAKAVYDVSGAGDTVISVYTLAKAAKAKSVDAAILANYAASIAVSKFGTAMINLSELKQSLIHPNNPPYSSS